MRDDFSDIQPIVAAALSDAVSFIDDDIGPDRKKAMDYYFGRPFGDEETGRSQVVSRDVHDMVSAAMPSLMRIFFGPEHVVEFEPFGPEDVEEAEQKTDYINYIVSTDNNGFSVVYAALKDALRTKVGIIKSWWDDTEETVTRTYSGLDEDAVNLLMQELQDLKWVQKADLIEAVEGENGLSVKVKLTKSTDRARIEAVPPEEFLISRNARSIDEAALVAHRSMKTRSDLIAMGYSEEDVEFGASEDLDWNDERLARNPSLTEGSASIDPAMRQMLYIEAFIRSDQDGDGIAELRRVCCIGSAYRVVADEPVDEHPFADFHCDPEPHTFFGESVYDMVGDIQVSKSRLLRAGHDSLANSVFPRTVVGKSGYVEDAMNTEVGAILRANGPVGDAYSFQAVPDTSRAVLPFLSYMDEVRENRTGMSKVSMGLDAEALQNTTATAAEGNFTRSQERLELIARIMSDGMRKLFRRLAKLVSENQRSERVIKLRNKWVPVNPSSWAADMNVICNVGLGGGSQAQKMSVLSLIAGKQEAIILQAGPNNPMVSLKQLYTTYSKMVQEAGFKNPDAFFTDPDGEEAQARAESAGPPPPDPKMVEVQAKLEMEREKFQAQQNLAEEKAVAELRLTKMRHEAQMVQDREKHALELQLRRDVASAEIAQKNREMDMEFVLKREKDAREHEASESTSIDGPQQGGEPG